ncbi:MAG: YggS family pyridoxal phosphate-dependent enzyme [Solirubrobacteraceae bacterium]|nr:YggS family pyridoxal phosphate-dependent enzyme [Solirubrobacteraceae bacterium]
MAELITGLEVAAVRANLVRVRAEIAAAAARGGRAPDTVTIVAATKYVAHDEMGVLAEAGITTVGENREQDLRAKVERYGDAFSWEFIGHLQSRKVKAVAPLVRRIHSASSDSVLSQLERHAPDLPHELEVLVEVNVSGEEAKSGLAPADLDAYLERLRSIETVRAAGLMTMPPRAETPEDSRRWFAALRDLASARNLPELSMGTTQDYVVAVEEGATLVRIGTSLFR